MQVPDIAMLSATLFDLVGGLTALFAVFILAADWLERLDDAPRGIVIGVFMGAVTIVSMISPFDFAPGIVVDVRNAVAGMSGLVGGPVAGVITMVMGAAYRAYLGGAGQWGGMSGIIGCGIVGILLHIHMHRHGGRLRFLDLGYLSIGIAVVTTLSFLLIPGIERALSIMSNVAPALTIAQTFSIAVVGTLFVLEGRRRKLREDLAKREKELQRALDTQATFLATMSHEIRTPLTGILGFGQLLGGTRLDGFQRRCVENISSAGTLLMRVINDILDHTKLQSGRVDIDRQPTEIRKMLSACRDLLSIEAEAKGLTVTSIVPESVPVWLMLDEVRVRQIILNIAWNAIKFTEKGGVTLDVAWHGNDQLTIRVSDTGIGIPQDKIENLFKPFEQAEQTIARRFGGTGLGLTIARDLCRMMGGEIAIDSTVDVGTRVTATLLAPQTDAAGSDMEPVQATRPVSGHILLAEDVVINQDLIVTILETAGHRVTVAGDGAAAVEAVKNHAFDMILMDVHMPGMDGLEATRQIRALPSEKSKIQIVALTADVMLDRLASCAAAGMDGHLTKPIEPGLLIETVNRVIALVQAKDRHSDDDGDQLGEHPVIDTKYLNSVITVVGKGYAKSLREGFWEELPGGFRSIEAAIGDRPMLQARAHQLVSLAGNAGYRRLAEHFRHLSSIVPTASEEAVLSELAAIRFEIERARKATSDLDIDAVDVAS